jgi:hypothetical protein
MKTLKVLSNHKKEILDLNLKKYLCILSGDDYSIISHCHKKLQSLFAAIGFFVFLIFILCFLSSYYSFSKLFNNELVGIPLSIFFAWMITNIYLLLLYTLTRNVLPHKSDFWGKLVSRGIRVAFIGFIALVVSKPIETLIFSIPLEYEIMEYKKGKIEKNKLITEQNFKEETENLKATIEKQIKLYGTDQIPVIQQYQQLLKKKEERKVELISTMKVLVNESNYYLQSVIILNRKYKSCWLITLVCFLIFLSPAYLKNFIAENSNFYQKKKQIEMSIILEEYASFKTRYKAYFKKFNQDVSYCEIYVDPPFNTLRKEDKRNFSPETDLISELYNA